MAHSAWLKLRRAEEHLNAIERDVTRFRNRKGNRIIVEGDPYSHVRPVRLRVRTEPPLERWGLTVGDCIHNARSALDHAVWGMTGQGVDNKDTRTQFPIFDDRKRFTEQGLPRLERIDPVLFRRELALIKWLQPYRRPNPQVSAPQVLNALDIADKHKTLGLGAVMPEMLHIAIQAGKGTTIHNPSVSWMPFRPPSFEDGVQLGVFTCSGITTVNDEPEVSVVADLSVTIVFRDGVPAAYRDWPALLNLERILARVRQILTALLGAE